MRIPFLSKLKETNEKIENNKALGEKKHVMIMKKLEILSSDDITIRLAKVVGVR